METALSEPRTVHGDEKYLTDESCIPSVPFVISGAMPRIPDELLHGIVFLYPTIDDARQNKRTGGTAFIVGHPIPRVSNGLGINVFIPFFVSNRHVVWDAACSVVRFNRRDGSGKILEFGPENWVVHPDGDDVAVACPFPFINPQEDEVTSAGFENLLTEEMARLANIGIGDDVFMIGRFLNHQGREMIRPAARFGNISMGPELIKSGASNRDQISYAVEMRSRTGFSGSPVIVYRQEGTAMMELPNGHETGWAILGVNWGHILDEDGENTWLNGVVPAWKIIDVFQTPEIQGVLEAIAEGAVQQHDSGVAEPSVAVEEFAPPTTDENP